MVDVTTSIQIDRPLKEVAEYTADPSHACDWYVNIKSSEYVLYNKEEKTVGLLSTGTQIAFVAEFLGRKLEYTYEVVEYDPLKKLVMRTADGPVPMETTYTWEVLEEDQTLMTLRNRGKPSGFSKWFAPFMKMAMKRANKKDLERLKRILEKGG